MLTGAELTAFIEANLPVVPVPAIPQIRLHKAGPRSGLRRLAEADPDFGSPYWAHFWGGGLALARYLLDRPDAVAGRSLLDLGAGSGIVGIAAAKAGARPVLAADSDPYARLAAPLNAALNDVSIAMLPGDPVAGPVPEIEIVAVGDLFYDADLAVRVRAWLDRCLTAGIEVLIGDPWRAHLPRERLRVLAEYEVAETGEAGGVKPAAVFAMKAS